MFLSLPDSAQKIPVNILPPNSAAPRPPPPSPEDAGAHGPCIFAIIPWPREDW